MSIKTRIFAVLYRIGTIMAISSCLFLGYGLIDSLDCSTSIQCSTSYLDENSLLGFIAGLTAVFGIFLSLYSWMRYFKRTRRPLIL